MRVLLLLMLAFGVQIAVAQGDTIKLINPSFEDSPRKGGTTSGIKGWFDCGIINFPKETPPDIHPKDFWSVRKQADDGRTYLGMVVRDNDTYESVSQKLPQSLKAGQCYAFSLSISKSEKYLSGSRYNMVHNKDDREVNYNTPSVLRIWGGSGFCDTKELLAETVVIKHSDWKKYTFKLSPSLNHKSITFEAYYKVPVLIPYCGHILLDNCSDIVSIRCEEEIAQVETKKKLPPHKRFKKRKNQNAVQAEAPETVYDTYYTRKKKILDLDRSKLAKGQTVEIKNLYFDADKSNIKTDSYSVLDEIFEFLKENRDITVEIGGHTNNQPPHDYCDSLSENRAKEVAVYLVDKGISGERVYYRGYGKRKAIASNLTKEGRMKNQRVEIKILSIG